MNKPSAVGMTQRGRRLGERTPLVAVSLRSALSTSGNRLYLVRIISIAIARTINACQILIGPTTIPLLLQRLLPGKTSRRS
jgi:hypothetical protein